MEDSPSKPSVAELAGRFKGHILPTPTSNGESPFRRRTPCSLKLEHQKDHHEESDKNIVAENPLKMKMKNSGIIEKLQANLALSPTALLPSPKSPEVKLQPAPASPTTPCCPQRPQSPALQPSRQSSEEEDPISFDSPAEGATLPSINKTRARLSFKRRPPTRQHRRSAGEEGGGFGSTLSPCELHSPKENGDMDHVFECGQPASVKEAEEMDRDCENTEDEVAKSDRGDPREQHEAEQVQDLDALEEQQPFNVKPEEKEEVPEEEHQ